MYVPFGSTKEIDAIGWVTRIPPSATAQVEFAGSPDSVNTTE